MHRGSTHCGSPVHGFPMHPPLLHGHWPLQVALIETRLVDLPKENTDAVQRVLYRARTGVKMGATGAPDGEEARALFLTWEELGPLLDYVPEDGE